MSDKVYEGEAKNTFSLKSIILFIGGSVIGLFGGILFPHFLHGGSADRNTGLTYNQVQNMIQDKSDSHQRRLELGQTIAANVSFEPIIEDQFPIEENLRTFPLNSKEEYITYMVANRGEERRYLEARWELSREYIETEELQGNAIAAFLQAPREHFVRQENIRRAYEDTWLPVGWGATITDPDVVSMMTTSLNLQPGQKVLEIGTGSGYQSSILSFMTDEVYSIEIIEPLYHETNQIYLELADRYPSFGHIRRKLDDGFYGWEKYAPFDAIIVTCAIDHIPPPLLRQLNAGGTMVVPLGPPGRQLIMQIQKDVDEQGNFSVSRRDVYSGLGVKFIPFRDTDGTSYSITD